MIYFQAYLDTLNKVNIFMNNLIMNHCVKPLAYTTALTSYLKAPYLVESTIVSAAIIFAARLKCFSKINKTEASILAGSIIGFSTLVKMRYLPALISVGIGCVYATQSTKIRYKNIIHFCACAIGTASTYWISPSINTCIGVLFCGYTFSPYLGSYKLKQKIARLNAQAVVHATICMAVAIPTYMLFTLGYTHAAK